MRRHFAGSLVMLAASGAWLVGCASSDDSEAVATGQESATAPVGGALSGITAADFQEALGFFQTVEEITDGLGPIFNFDSCGGCHSLGAPGGSGEQIERRYGRFVNGAFDPLANKGGSLRQLFALDPFTGANGQSCTVPVEKEPPEATVHNVGRLTTPLFGLGLVDSLPDSTFDAIAASQPAATRGIVNRVTV